MAMVRKEMMIVNKNPLVIRYGIQRQSASKALAVV
jgi:hypothetical protein